jgi:hypothetical protein
LYQKKVEPEMPSFLLHSQTHGDVVWFWWLWDDLKREALMYAVIRKFNKMRSVEEAARRAESGLGPILRQSPGFQGYYIVNGGNDTAVSITIFETPDAAEDAHRRAMDWIKDNLSDFVEGKPEVITGQVLVSIPVQPAMAA